jgi:tetratricopeptide (TPR) repeat protein
MTVFNLLVLLGTAAIVWFSQMGLGWADSVPQFQGIPLPCYVEVSQKLTEGNSQAFTLSEIADKYISAKQNDRAVELLDKAVQLLEDSKDSSPKAYLLLEIADRYAKAGQKQQAEAVIGKAFTLVKGFPNQVDRVFATIKVAHSLADLSQKEKANRLLTQALLPTKDLTDVYAKSRAYAAIAGGLAQVGDLPAAANAITQAQTYAVMSTEASVRARALIEVAATYAELKDHPQAVKYLQSAFKEIAKEIPDQYKADFNARTFALMVERYLSTDQPDQARQVLTNIDDGSIEKGIGLLNLASRYRKDNQLDQAKSAISESQTKISALPDSLDKAAVLAEIGAGYLQLDDREGAISALALSGQVAGKLTIPTEKIYALTSLASQYAELGDNATAQQYLDQSFALLTTATKAKQITNYDRAASDIAGLYWQVGQREAANRTADTMGAGTEKDQITALFACAAASK